MSRNEVRAALVHMLCIGRRLRICVDERWKMEEEKRTMRWQINGQETLKSEDPPCSSRQSCSWRTTEDSVVFSTQASRFTSPKDGNGG
jgi:hypothetical protein